MFRYLLIVLICSYANSQLNCDVVIIGGTLASLGAAIHAPDGFKSCLIEPTSRLGGQLGDEGVLHIDFNWLFQKDYPDTHIAYNPKNIHPLLDEICTKCNTGDCWVSRNCFEYSCIERIFKQKLKEKKNLTIYYDSVVKSIQKLGSKISSVQIITRSQPKTSNQIQDCRYFDEVLNDWYSREPSQYYRKSINRLNVNFFLIEASQYGDALVLSNASYMQGTANKSTCGQSTVFGIQQIYPQIFWNKANIRIEEAGDDDFSLGTYTAEQVWRYRRLVGKGLGIKKNQISLQNWNGPGNDYKGGYLFVDAKSTINDWKGGVNFTTLKEAELRSLRFHNWFKQVANLPLQIYKNQTKTCIGTTRLPYVRDGRRSIGYQNFYLKPEDVTGNYKPGGSPIATPFTDRVAIGMYNMDVHSINNCTYETYPQNYPLPFFLPLRAFSNKDIDNLIPAGRAMAQEFFVSSATRTHATELASGAASMMIASYMRTANIKSVWNLLTCPECISQLQRNIRMVMPLQWTINDKKYPQTNSQFNSHQILQQK